MKTVNDKQQIWFERNNNLVTVGFTKPFLDSLDQCWHILPANLQRFREKAPLMVIETNDSLISILSPVTAHFDHWSDKAQNFPYKLTEEDVVLSMNVTDARRTINNAPPVTVGGNRMWGNAELVVPGPGPIDWRDVALAARPNNDVNARVINEIDGQQQLAQVQLRGAAPRRDRGVF